MGDLLLHLHGTAHRPVDAIEHDEQRVAAGIDDPAAVLLDRGVDEAACGRPTKVAEGSHVVPGQFNLE